MYRLTDEEINGVLDLEQERSYRGKDSETDTVDVYPLLDEQIAKLQRHYRDMTPAELREELKRILVQRNKALLAYGQNPTSDYSAAQILSLVNGNLIEMIKGIENPYLDEPNGYVWNDAIQEVIKEVEK